MSEIKLPHHHGDEEHEAHLKAHLEHSDSFEVAADVFKQLSDATRIRIFWLLCHCEECVLNVSALVNMTSPAVSHHLKQLKSANLVTSRRAGREVYYRAADTEEARLLHQAIERIIAISCPVK